MHILPRAGLLIIFLIMAIVSCFAQHVNDSLLDRVAKRFEESQHLALQKIIGPVVISSEQLPEERMPCYSGKQVTIVAVYNVRPAEAYGRMLVMKRFPSSTRFDEHLFQQADYDKSFNIYYALLSVYFPPEATFKNCNTVLQVYDKQKHSNKVWLIILTK